MTLRIVSLCLFFSVQNLLCLWAQSPLAQTVDFTCINCLPADALVQLSRVSGVTIAFSDRFFEQCPPVTIRANGEPIKRVLELVSGCSKVAFKQVGNQIVFY